jgi:hypothetical protein
MSERSTGSQYDRKQVDGNGEQRRQQNEQSNNAGGQQGDAAGSMGAGSVGTGSLSHDNQQAQGMNPGPGGQGLANQSNHGQTQQQAGAASTSPEGGTANRAGNANESGSMGSTRRDDAPRRPQR